MNRILLSTLFYILLVQNGFSEWKSIVQNKGYKDTYYIDTQSIRKFDNKVLWWELRDGPIPISKKYFSTLHYMEGDCNYFRHKILSQTWLTGRMGVGRRKNNENVNSKWVYPPPKSTGSVILNYVCRQ